MVRPGPKTTQDEVKTAVVRLLKEHSEGLNFNEIFRRLKEQGVLGSFSVLSKAIKDLSESKIVSYKDLEKPSYKIPKRIYMLTQKTQDVFQQLEFKRPQPDQHIITTEKASMDLFKGIKKPSEAVFLSRLLYHAISLTTVYKQIVKENGDPNGLWRLLLNDVLRGERKYWETRAEWARSRKIPPLKEEHELARIIQVLSKWREMLTIYGISLQKELVEKVNKPKNI